MIVNVEGEIVLGAFARLQREISRTTENEITIVVDSYGGNAFEGLAMYEYLRNCGKKITTVAKTVYSIANVIFLAGDIRIVSDESRFMTHLPFVDTQALVDMDLSALDRHDLTEIATHLKKVEKQMLDIYISRGGLSSEIYENLFSEKQDNFFGAETALEIGFATKKEKSLSFSKFKNHAATLNFFTQKNPKMSNLFKRIFDAFKAEGIEIELPSDNPENPEKPEKPEKPMSDTVTREEFDALKSEITNIKQMLSEMNTSVEKKMTDAMATVENAAVENIKKGFETLQKDLSKLATNGSAKLPKLDPASRNEKNGEPKNWKNVNF